MEPVNGTIAEMNARASAQGASARLITLSGLLLLGSLRLSRP